MKYHIIECALEKIVITTETFKNDMEKHTVVLKILENILLELFLNLDIAEMIAYEFLCYAD